MPLIVRCTSCAEKWSYSYLKKNKTLFLFDSENLITSCPHCSIIDKENLTIQLKTTLARQLQSILSNNFDDLSEISNLKSEKIISVCCICKKYKNEKGEYVDVKCYAKENDIRFLENEKIEDRIVSQLNATLSHGFCSTCMKNQIETLKKYRNCKKGE